MAERVTRQFADVPSGEPVIGGLFRLVNLTDSADTPRDMLEATDPDFPGRYYTADGEDLAPGVWQVQRNSGAGYVPTGEEIHVSPRRVNVGEISAENTVTTFVDYVVADVVRAAAFVPVGTAPGTPILPYLQTAVNYAASKGFRKVYVGNWGDRNLWEGAAQLNLTAIPGITLDLGGAEISRAEGLTPLLMAGGTVRNGLIAGTGSELQIINTTDTVNCEDVVFGEHLGATIKNGDGYAAARFVRCSGHRIWAESLASSPTRFQVTDTMTVDKDNGAFQPPHEANVDAAQLGGFFQEALTVESTDAPGDAASPFDTALTMARALKRLWYVTRVYVETIPGRLSDIADAIAAIDNIRTEDITIPPGEPCYVMVTNTTNPGGISTAQASGFKDVSTRKFPSENGSGNFGVVEADLWIQTPDTTWAGPSTELSVLKEIAIPVSVSDAILDGVSFPTTAPCEVTATIFASGATDPKVAYCEGLLTLQSGILKASFKPAFIRADLVAGNAYWRIHLHMKITNTASGMGWN